MTEREMTLKEVVQVFEIMALESKVNKLTIDKLHNIYPDLFDTKAIEVIEILHSLEEILINTKTIEVIEIFHSLEEILINAERQRQFIQERGDK